ncbi:hypothetical protein CoNPh11_CDS0002 [Staphylococcus phage S-CoN_Ph11]|nr:hypothetical protein CoNPh11_CDS0002 [Staphylococcus phage S-CoN_Ph11]WNM53459.1 hypothetical protein CoNPh12_CDS0172 [Staphylococcus phage S-CoN_Ph12]
MKKLEKIYNIINWELENEKITGKIITIFEKCYQSEIIFTHDMGINNFEKEIKENREPQKLKIRKDRAIF